MSRQKMKTFGREYEDIRLEIYELFKKLDPSELIHWFKEGKKLKAAYDSRAPRLYLKNEHNYNPDFARHICNRDKPLSTHFGKGVSPDNHDELVNLPEYKWAFFAFEEAEFQKFLEAGDKRVLAQRNEAKTRRDNSDEGLTNQESFLLQSLEKLADPKAETVDADAGGRRVKSVWKIVSLACQVIEEYQPSPRVEAIRARLFQTSTVDSFTFLDDKFEPGAVREAVIQILLGNSVIIEGLQRAEQQGTDDEKIAAFFKFKNIKLLKGKYKNLAKKLVNTLISRYRRSQRES